LREKVFLEYVNREILRTGRRETRAHLGGGDRPARRVERPAAAGG